MYLVSQQVEYIDFGNMEWVSFDSLCSMCAVDREEPAQAMEFFLTGIKPPLGNWTEEACLVFSNFILDKHLMANVRDARTRSCLLAVRVLPPICGGCLPQAKGHAHHGRVCQLRI